MPPKINGKAAARTKNNTGRGSRYLLSSAECSEDDDSGSDDSSYDDGAGDSASDGNNIVDDSPLDEVRVEIPSPVGSQLLVATRCCDLQYTAVLH